MTVYLANDDYSATLRSTWVSSPADTTLAVTAIPTNTPTIITVGWDTIYETVFYVTGTSGTSSSNYTLTGVTRLKGYNGNLAENLSLNCLNHEEYFNQWSTLITAINEQLDGTDAAGISPADIHLPTGGQIDVNSVDPWRTITLKPGFLKPTTTAGCATSAQSETTTNKINYDTLDFDTSTEEHAYAIFSMPDSWDAGVIQFRAKWTAASGSGGVAWGLAGVSFADSDALDTAVGTEVVVTDTLITAEDVHQTSWSSDVTLAGTPAAGEEIYLELARVVANGSDTLGVDAKLISLQVRYKQTTFSD